MPIEYYTYTNPGGREENEDYTGKKMVPSEQRYLFVVADGLGGHRGGQVAAKMAVTYLLDSFDRLIPTNLATTLVAVFQAANQQIVQQGANDYRLQDMKTTCVALLILQGIAYWAHIGDSRFYLMRKGLIVQRTKDHSVAQTLVTLGEIAAEELPKHPQRHELLRVLGIDYPLEPTVQANGVVLQPGDTMLLCTDGFWEHCTDAEIAQLSSRLRVAELLAKVKARGSQTPNHFDNFTLQWLRVT
jgi:serine/threonine protein phosphatase PrpC